MVKVKYDGAHKSCNIKIGNAIFKKWLKGEVKELSIDDAALLKNNKDFLVVSGEVKKEEVKIVNEPKEKKIVEEIDDSDKKTEFISVTTKEVVIDAETIHEGD